MSKVRISKVSDASLARRRWTKSQANARLDHRTVSGSEVGRMWNVWINELGQDADMGHLVAIEAELIRVQPTAAEGGRRRLLIERGAAGTRRLPVRVTSLRHERCTIASPRPIAEFDGNWWLKMPGLEACHVALIGEWNPRPFVQAALLISRLWSPRLTVEDDY
jgi:hypothetical protein